MKAGFRPPQRFYANGKDWRGKFKKVGTRPSDFMRAVRYCVTNTTSASWSCPGPQRKLWKSSMSDGNQPLGNRTVLQTLNLNPTLRFFMSFFWAYLGMYPLYVAHVCERMRTSMCTIKSLCVPACTCKCVVQPNCLIRRVFLMSEMI